MRNFSINIEGRVKNFSLPKNQPLIPLFEAIVNSIHSIEERKRNEPSFNKGNIVIEIERSMQNPMQEIAISLPIENFCISDNGVGFDEPNIKSFMESDSTYKASIGGKGVGRFSWLVAFKKATIESIYCDNGQYVKRSFDFSTYESSIDDKLEECNEHNDNLTTVRLINCLKPYQVNLPKNAEIICMRIIQHCLSYFIADECPNIELIDDGIKYNLNSIFRDKIKADDNKTEISINGESFELLHVKAEESTINGNKLFLCANSRLVDTKELEKYIVDLDKTIYNENKFWYIGVLTGKYLDENVDMNRLSFDIPDKGSSENAVNTLSIEKIMNEVCVEIKKYLSDYLAPISENKTKRIKEYVTYEAPQFRHLLKHKYNDVASIKPNLTEEKLDDELHKIKRNFDKEIKEKNKKLLKGLNEGSLNYEDYQSLFNEQIEKINDANGAVLAEYVAHRKVIIDLLEFAINKKDDGKFQKEKYIHNLIYPMRSTSEDVIKDNHNLWLIDEKLAYCSYISSDIPFNNDPKEERTDIMILDNPVAVSEDKNDGTEFDTIILFELKRPMRDDYTDGNNPITQLYDYIDKIKSGNARDKNGRKIRAGDSTKFYLYAVCDVTSKLERIIRHNELTNTPDKMGYYRYHKEYNAYVEILPYNKIINDSKKRNKILFDKLGI